MELVPKSCGAVNPVDIQAEARAYILVRVACFRKREDESTHIQVGADPEDTRCGLGLKNWKDWLEGSLQQHAESHIQDGGNALFRTG